MNTMSESIASSHGSLVTQKTKRVHAILNTWRQGRAVVDERRNGTCIKNLDLNLNRTDHSHELMLGCLSPDNFPYTDHLYIKSSRHVDEDDIDTMRQALLRFLHCISVTGLPFSSLSIDQVVAKQFLHESLTTFMTQWRVKTLSLTVSSREPIKSAHQQLFADFLEGGNCCIEDLTIHYLDGKAANDTLAPLADKGKCGRIKRFQLEQYYDDRIQGVDWKLVKRVLNGVFGGASLLSFVGVNIGEESLEVVQTIVDDLIQQERCLRFDNVDYAEDGEASSAACEMVVSVVKTRHPRIPILSLQEEDGCEDIKIVVPWFDLTKPPALVDYSTKIEELEFALSVSNKHMRREWGANERNKGENQFDIESELSILRYQYLREVWVTDDAVDAVARYPAEKAALELQEWIEKKASKTASKKSKKRKIADME